MADWDADGPELAENLKAVLRLARDHASRRVPVSVDDAKVWHARIMRGLRTPNTDYIGRFRGEPGLALIGVRIGEHEGTLPDKVDVELADFESHLNDAIQYLDQLIPAGSIPSADHLDAVLDGCGWTHAEWVRIHPFTNGNGRTARIWANMIAMRYGLPPFVRLRPRPQGDLYAAAGAHAMTGDWAPTADLFRSMLEDFLVQKE